MHPLSKDLLNWYDAHRRVLPWRDDGAGPYRTWVSEVMLQQTRVDTVIPYFERFMKRFPTVDALAAGPLDDVLALWSGLGYYSRARNLFRGAQLAVAAGGVPHTVDGLRALPGVGPYMAGAIGSIALGLDEPAVDGNLERVLARVRRHAGGRVQMTAVARELLPPGRAGDFNQALMDLGSGTCTARSPACERCPIRAHCAAGATSDPSQWPAPRVKKKAPQRKGLALRLSRDGAIWMVRRPPTGLFGGLYDLPWVFRTDGDSPKRAGEDAVENWALGDVSVGKRLGTARHLLTHMRLQLDVYAAAGVPDPTSGRWVTVAERDGLGLSTLARKAMDASGG